MLKKIEKIVVVVILVGMCFASYIGNHYTVKATVVAVDDATNTSVITFEDTRGELWRYATNECFEEGQKVKLTFDTNLTDNIITDDIITKVKGA
jgi:hypothetical protein